jgi:hypothetical protein
MSYRAYHDYDDDRDVITCVTLSDTRPVARKEHTCGGCEKTIPVGARHRRRFMLVDGEPWHEKTCRDCEYYHPEGQAAGVRAVTPSPATAGGSYWS